MSFSCSVDESVKDLLQGEYTDYYNEDSDYPDISSIEISSQFPRPRPTAASVMLEDLRRTNKQVGMKRQ